jgi:serine/threonine protein kinase/tetratricopeptide (TPR) repeat protein
MECGATIPAGSPAGLCGKCLFGLGLAPAREEPSASASTGAAPEGADRLPAPASDTSEAPPPQSSRGKLAPPPKVVVTEKPGDVIGPYKLLQQIGEGGFGLVYMAQQQEPVRRRVALKIIKLGMDTRQVVARFDGERQALALMDHPNIAKMLHAGATDTGRPYFVMELVQGIKITDYCDQNNLSTRERLGLFVQICRAIQHAHQKGIIHRDIKPSNILVTLHDGVPVPKIIDFGIAKATQQELTEQTVFTHYGQFVGTPAYMSPEQAEMSGLDIDTRSDIYSLGVLLYELLTGKTPFDTKALLSAGVEELRRTIREQEPARPSTRLSTLAAGDLTATARHRRTEPPKLLKLVRGDLDWIVMRCLEKDRTRRYETATGLAMDVERHLNQEPVVARPPSRLYRFRKLVRRHKLAFAAAAVIMATLVLGLGASSWLLIREREAHREARTEAVKSRQVVQFLKSILDGVGPAKARGRDVQMLREILDETAKGIGKGLKDQPEVEAEVRATLGEVYQALAVYPEAETMYRTALELRRHVFGPGHPTVALSLNELGGLRVIQGNKINLAEAETLFREALAIAQRRFGAESAEFATSLTGLGTALEMQGRLPEAEAAQRQALVVRRKLTGPENAGVAEVLDNLGSVLRREGRLPEVEDIQRQILPMMIKLFGPVHPRVADCLGNLAFILAEEGKLGEAENLHRECLAMRKTLFGPEHPDIAESLHNLANVLADERKFTEAEDLYREAAAMRAKFLGHNHRYVGASLNNLSRVLREQQRLAEAEAVERQALEVYTAALGAEHPVVAIGLYGLAALQRDQGKLTEAEHTARQCVELRERRTPEDWQNFEARTLLGEILLAENKPADAEPLLRTGYQGLEQREAKIPASGKSRLHQAAQALANLYDTNRQPDEAAVWKQKLAVLDQNEKAAKSGKPGP